MKEKLLALMQNEGLKPSRLAEMLDVNPAGISHILAGRNKPGFDLLQKILRRFPRINPDWLLLDNGPMYRDSEPTDFALPSEHTPQPQPDVTASRPAAPSGDLFDSPRPDNPTSPITPPSTGTVPPAAMAATFPSKTQNRSAAVRRVVIFYDDDSFEAYFPTAR